MAVLQQQPTSAGAGLARHGFPRTVAGTCGASPAPTPSGRAPSPAHKLLHIAAAAQRRRCWACPARFSANRGGNVRSEPRTYLQRPHILARTCAPAHRGAAQRRRCRACPARLSANRGGSVRGEPRTYGVAGCSGRSLPTLCGAGSAPTSSGRTSSPAHALLHVAAASHLRRCRACPARLLANRGGSVRGEPRTYGMAGCSRRSLPTLCGASPAPTSSGRTPSPAHRGGSPPPWPHVLARTCAPARCGGIAPP